MRKKKIKGGGNDEKLIASVMSIVIKSQFSKSKLVFNLFETFDSKKGLIDIQVKLSGITNSA